MRARIEQLPARLQEQVRRKLAEEDARKRPVEARAPRVFRSTGNKYYAVPVSHDGKRFDSKKEYRTYLNLRALEKRGEITDLRVHVKFSIFDPGMNCRGEHIATYKADFVFKKDGKTVVADAKSNKTRKLRDWPRTKKLLRMCHGYEVMEL